MWFQATNSLPYKKTNIEYLSLRRSSFIYMVLFIPKSNFDFFCHLIFENSLGLKFSINRNNGRAIVQSRSPFPNLLGDLSFYTALRSLIKHSLGESWTINKSAWTEFICKYYNFILPKLRCLTNYNDFTANFGDLISTY